MNIAQLISLLPEGTAGEYCGDVGVEFRGLTVRFDGRRLNGKFVVMLTNSWGSKRDLSKYCPPENNLSQNISLARENGAAGFVLPQEYRGNLAVKDLNCFFVKDTTAFTFAVAHHVRRGGQAAKVIAITGSAGKSTTKAMITHALRDLVPKNGIYSPGSSQNIEASVLGHLSMNHRFQYQVLEIAGSAFRRFRRNGFSVSPDISIVTSISEAHLDYLKSTKNVAEVKSDIFNSPPPNGTAIINLDTLHSDVLVRRAVRAGCQLVTYGESPEATIRLLDYDLVAGIVIAAVGEEVFTFTVKARGKHMAQNSLAVIAVLRAYGFRDWRRAVATLASFNALSGRGEQLVVNLPGGSITLIDETYNANPASMRAAISTLRGLQVSDSSRKVAILGDILELGEESASLHLDLVETIDNAQFDQVHFVGKNMTKVHEKFSLTNSNSLHWDDIEALGEALKGTLREGDIVLLKSSNGTGLNRIVSKLVG